MTKGKSNEFFVAFGRRLVQFRKDANLTQEQLAQKLGLKQQLVAAYEKGIRRIPLSYLVPLAQALHVDVEELLAVKKKKTKRGPQSLVQKRLEEIQKLPSSKQKFVIEFLDTVIQSP